MNVAAYFWSDKFAIRASRAKPVSEEEAPDLHKMVNELAEPVPGAQAAGLHDPVRAAERVRDRPQPEARRRRGHAGAAPHMPYDQVRAVMAHEFATSRTATSSCRRSRR